MRKLVVVLAAAIVFSPRLALPDQQVQRALPDSPPSDLLPASAPVVSFVPQPKPLLILGLLAAFSQWRLGSNSNTTFTASTTPYHSVAQGFAPPKQGAAYIVPDLAPLHGYGTPAAQPHRRAPPQS
jgi:hypothetical protein